MHADFSVEEQFPDVGLVFERLASPRALANGGTASVTIVVKPTRRGPITNQSGVLAQ